MRIRNYLGFILSFFVFGSIYCQTELRTFTPDTTAFNYRLWDSVAKAKHYHGEIRNEFMQFARSNALDMQLEAFKADTTRISSLNSKVIGNGTNVINVVNGPCTNIDFELGNISGWTATNGFNPNSGSTPTCCPTPGGAQTIMSGPGLDPFGGFPVVFPGGGSFSVRLGNSGTGARSDRLEQTFSVTPANANFTYRYAVVLQNPGHDSIEQPSFEIQMLTFPAGTAIPCTFYQVVADSFAVGFYTSTVNSNVQYKPWTSVAVDLTPVIGQNVTIRFTTNDCSLGGHFGYAYIDGFCTNFATSVADTTCENIPFLMCGPPGFGMYQWNGPGVVSNTNACISVSTTGVYVCTTTLVPGCPGPAFSHTLSTYASPVLTFTPSTTGNCSNQYSFASTSSISAGTINSYTYSFGDNTSALGQSATHSYPPPGAGTYTVTFKATSSRGCNDSAQQVVTIYPFPVIAFSPPSHCINSMVQFTNTSAVPPVIGVPPGSISSFTWNLGNGQVSNSLNPTATYTNSGTYTITLGVTSDQGCITTGNQTLGIFPPPVLDFTANPLCDINGSTFSPFTSTSVSSGSLVGFQWNFGDGGTSTLANPTHTYMAPGVYTITFKATTNHFCVDSVTRTFSISPTPTVAFTTTSINACSPQFTFTNGSAVGGGSPLNYSWNFGGTNTTSVQNPTYTFPGVGNYTVQLVGSTSMGCPDTALTFITIHPFPVVSVSVPVSCESSAISITTSILSGTLNSFVWDFGDPLSGAANSSTLQNPSHTYSTVGAYTISLQMLSDQNCPMSYTTNVDTRPNPVPSFNFFPPDACTITFTFMNNSGFVPPLAPNTISTYSWTFEGINTSAAFSPTYNFPGPGIYTVNLLAISNFSCMSTTAQTLAIHPYPQASLSVLNSCINVPAAFGGTTDISQIPFPASVVSYTWNFGDGIFDNTLNPTHTYLTFGNYFITFGVTSNQGCVSTVTTNLQIHPLPTAFNFNFVNPCLGNAASFTSSATMPPGYNISGYRWDFDNDGIINSTAVNPAHTYTAPGTYSVELRIVTNNNCIDSITKTLIVYDIPTSVISTTNVCFKKGTPFSAASSSPGVGSSFSSFSWSFGDGSTGVTQGGLHNYSAPGNYTLFLTTTNNNNCSHSTSTVVTVHQLPIVDFTATAVCLGTATSFTNFSSIGTPDQIVKYRWDFGTGWEDSVNVSPTKTFTNNGNYTVKLEAYSNNQCSENRSRNIIVYGNPVANFSNSRICVGDKITFYDLSSTSDGTITANTWDYNGDGVIDYVGTSPSFVYGLNGTFTVRLDVSTNNGCTATKTKTVIANPKAVPVFTSDKKSGCPTLCVNFTSLSYINTGTFTTRWDFGDGSPGGTFAEATHCFGSGSYPVSITLVSDSGCVSSAGSPGYITVFPNPVAAFSVDPPEVDEDDPTINVYTNASSDTYSQTYYISDGYSTIERNFTHYIKNLSKKTKPMVVQIVKTVHGCIDTAYKVLDIKPVFVIYVPNVFTPNDDGTNDRFMAKGVGIVKFDMQIYDRWGHLVWDTHDIIDSWDGTAKGGVEIIKEDVYTWKAQVTDIFGKRHLLVGHVTVIK